MGLLGSQNAEDFSTTDEVRFDWSLLFSVVAIMVIGLFQVYSATSNGFGGETPAYMTLKQFVFCVSGLALIGLFMLIDYRLIERISYILYGLNLAALALVPFLGVVRYGARRWINLGIISYQPSETMKFATILALAKYFQEKDSIKSMDFKDLIVPGLIVGIPGLLTVIQPDLGTGGHLMITGVVILLFVGIRARVLLFAGVLAVVSFPLAYQHLKPYQQDRIKTFIDPMVDPKGQGYNALQAMIAVGSGELIGKGFRKGTQTQLDFTPEHHTDFIFTVLAEEWGFVGTSLLFGLYTFFFARCVRIAALARDKFGSLVCVGIIGMLLSQILINVSMVSGMFPIVGIPLPLLSYGGTSVLTVSLAIAILENVRFRKSIF